MRNLRKADDTLKIADKPVGVTYKKVVVNHSFGVFNLSDEAWIAYAKEKPSDLNSISFRTDLDLVRIVEQLGERANGQTAFGLKNDLKIIEIPEGIKVKIESYDGNEWVAEEHRVWGKNI